MYMSNNVQTGGKLKKDLGFPAAVAMVVGSVIGSGIFMAPQNMAEATNPKTAMLAWIITAAGSICIVLSFSHMVELIPRTGGPVIYADAAFGQWGGFSIAWSYWACAWISQAAFITGGVRYLSVIFPIIDQNRVIAFVVASSLLWILNIINIFGVKKAGYVQVATTICKLVPLIVFVILALFHFNIINFNTVSSLQVDNSGTLPSAIAITMWAFLGFEMATVPAGETKNAGSNLKKAVLYGTLFVAIVYLIINFLASGILPQSQLARSTAPFADMINFMVGGTWAGKFIAIGVVISVLGAANGNVIVISRTAYGAAKIKLFPDIFTKINSKYGTPVISIIISGVLTNLILTLNYVKSLNAAFTFMILIATLSSMPAYLMTEGAEILFLKNKFDKISIGKFLKSSAIPLIAFIYTLYITYATGAKAVMWGFMLIAVGMPFYIYIKIKNGETEVPDRDKAEI